MDNLTTDTFIDTLQTSSVPVLVDFWAEWCGPCKMIAPTLEKLSQEYAGKIKIVKLNVDNYPDIAQQYIVRSIPNLMFFVDGAPVASVVGSDKEGIENQIKQLI